MENIRMDGDGFYVMNLCNSFSFCLCVYGYGGGC